jgi:hypothetical protein
VLVYAVGSDKTHPEKLEVSFLSSRRASACLWQNLASYRLQWRRSSERVVGLGSAVATCRLLTATAGDPAEVTVARVRGAVNGPKVTESNLLDLGAKVLGGG